MEVHWRQTLVRITYRWNVWWENEQWPVDNGNVDRWQSGTLLMIDEWGQTRGTYSPSIPEEVPTTIGYYSRPRRRINYILSYWLMMLFARSLSPTGEMIRSNFQCTEAKEDGNWISRCNSFSILHLTVFVAEWSQNYQQCPRLAYEQNYGVTVERANGICTHFHFFFVDESA